jgi:hypothetical protein
MAHEKFLYAQGPRAVLWPYSTGGWMEPVSSVITDLRSAAELAWHKADVRVT